MRETFAGRQIVLAGGTGGLGAPLARGLAGEGAKLTVSYLSDSRRAEELAAIAKVVRTDLRSPEERARLLDEAPALYGLVVLSGYPARVASAEELETVMIRSHEVNYLGPILLAREAAERMRCTEIQGAIVLVSTMQAVSVFPGSTAYAGAKAALIHAARILAKECRGRDNIRVNVVCPGVNAAGMAQASIASGKYDRYIAEGALPRFGEAADVARAIRFLLEPDSYVTGQVLTVDGGLTL